MDASKQSPEIEAFLKAHGVVADGETPWEVRRLGTDEAMVERILAVIARGEKTMTFSLPWVAEAEGAPPPSPGGCIVLLGADGAPRMLVRIAEVKARRFGDVSEADLAREGIPMRDPTAWRDLHRLVWNAKLAPLGRAVSDDMPVWAEYFDLIGSP